MPDIKQLTAKKVSEGPLPTGAEVPDAQLVKLPVEKIKVSPFQPRKHFSEERREEMRQSLRSQGLLEPITVEPHPTEAGMFILISGENRWRGHKDLLAETGDEKWATILSIVRPASPPGKGRAKALVANLQRADLTPLEEGDGYLAMRDEDGLSIEQIAKEVGLGEDRIERCIRIAAGPDSLRAAMEQGLRVPKLDADGKPEVKHNPDGSVKMQKVQTPKGEKELPEPVLVVRVIREITIAEQLASLYKHIKSTAPKGRDAKVWAEREFRPHLEHVLMHDMEKRRVVEYVKRAKAGGKGGAKQDKGAEEPKPTKVVALPKGTAFVNSTQQLVVQKDALGGLDQAQRAELRAELEALLASLREDAAAA